MWKEVGTAAMAITVFAIWFAVVTLGLLHFRRCPALEFFYNQFTFGAARSVVKTFHGATKQQSQTNVDPVGLRFDCRSG